MPDTSACRWPCSCPYWPESWGCSIPSACCDCLIHSHQALSRAWPSVDPLSARPTDGSTRRRSRTALGRPGTEPIRRAGATMPSRSMADETNNLIAIEPIRPTGPTGPEFGGSGLGGLERFTLAISELWGTSSEPINEYAMPQATVADGERLTAEHYDHGPQDACPSEDDVGTLRLQASNGATLIHGARAEQLDLLVDLYQVELRAVDDIWVVPR